MDSETIKAFMQIYPFHNGPVYSTPDDRIHLSTEGAIKHCALKHLNEDLILEWEVNDDTPNAFTEEDLKKAFKAGCELVHQDWHEQEFCLGQNCKCKSIKLKYSNFDEWLSQNYS